MMVLDLMVVLVFWVFAGFITGILAFLATSHIPMIVPGIILGVCGGLFHIVMACRNKPFPYYLSIIVIAAASLAISFLLIPDTRHWAIARLLIIFYLLFSAMLWWFFRKLLPLSNT